MCPFYNQTAGGNLGAGMFLAWITYILIVALVITVLVLAIVALWKYIQKK